MVASTSVRHAGEGASTSEFRECAKTVMDATDPDITFDADGVSNHWHDYHKEVEAQARIRGQHSDPLQAAIDRVREAGKGKPYDCVLGLSGGVDSSYLAHLASERGLRPLVVHFDNGWNSEVAVSNIERLVARMGYDLYTYVMDWPEFRDLQRAYFKASVLDLEVPTDHMIFGALYAIAGKHGISYILSGNNIATESILPKAWYYPKFDLANLQDIHRRFGTVPLRHLPAFGLRQMAYYTGFRNIRDVKLLNLMDYDKAAAKRLLSESYGWRDYGGKHYESVFTRFYQGYILPRKFGIDKRKAHLSNLICGGQITRDEAVAELRQPTYDPGLQAEDKVYVAKKLGFTAVEFEALLTQPNRSHSEFASDAVWRKRYFRMMRALAPATALLKLQRGRR